MLDNKGLCGVVKTKNACVCGKIQFTVFPGFHWYLCCRGNVEDIGQSSLKQERKTVRPVG